MKKHLFIVAALFMLLGSAVGANAKGNSDGQKYPWFITVAGGPQVYFGEYDNVLPFGQRISTNLEIGAGKWIEHWAGVRVMLSGATIKGATANNAHSTGAAFYPDGQKFEVKKQRFNFMNIHADAMFNLSHVVMGGYKADRIYNCSPYIGIGVITTWDNPKKTTVSGNFGLFNGFRITDEFELNIDLRAMVVPENFDGEIGGRKGEGMLSASFGFTYNFR